MSDELNAAADAVNKKLSKWELRYACQRCKGDHQDINEVHKLLGGYSARICTDCVNDWHEFVQKDERYLELRKFSYESQIYAQAGQVHEAKHLAGKVAELTDAFYEVAKRWMQETSK